MKPLNFKPGNLVVIQREHRVATEATKHYCREWSTKNYDWWPWNTPRDLLIPEGQVALVLSYPLDWTPLALVTLPVMIYNEKLGYKHLVVQVNAFWVRKV